MSGTTKKIRRNRINSLLNLDSVCGGFVENAAITIKLKSAIK
jgi:hypothetical protein